MKKVYLLLTMLFATSVTFGQLFQVENATYKKVTLNHQTAKVPTDTTGLSTNFIPVFAPGNQVWTYTNQGGGYVYGVNNIVNNQSINRLAQGYSYLTGGQIGIEGVTMWFCGKTSVSGNPNSKLKFQIYNKPDSVPTTPVSTVTAELLFNDCDTNFLEFNTAMFPSVIPVSNDFSIVCDLSTLVSYGDTIGFHCDANGEGVGWAAFRFGQNWYTYVFGYKINNNIALFAIVDVNYVGIDDNVFFQGSKMSFNNPAKNNLIVDYAVENDAKVVFELISLKGQVVYKSDEGFKTKGNIYTINADISNLPAGAYLCSLSSNGKRLIKKVIIE